MPLDEIEKAHPSIFDKFLQILGDGRMTDGQREANVTSQMPYQEMSARVREAIEDYFKLQLGRPEILNRIGENIVVFDYIRPDVAALPPVLEEIMPVRWLHTLLRIKYVHQRI